MAASSSSLSIHSVSHRNLPARSFIHEYSHRNQNNARSPSSLMMPNHTESTAGKGRITSMATSAKITHFNKLLQTRDHGIGAKISGENLDKWMRESVVDIVKNLHQAPLLVQVYEEINEKNGAETRLETEKAVKEIEWAGAKGRWERGESPLPQGVIFVEELGEEEERSSESKTKAWGIVVQGRGAECGPMCYLLKTSRVKGVGSFCTHFCLARVKGFKETTESQLKNCWLVQPAFSSTN